jgi:acyl dehydratase
MAPKTTSDEEYRTRYLDDLEVGEAFESEWTSLSIEEMLRFSNEFDRQYFHTDVEAAADSPFGEIIASGAHTFAVWNRINLDVNGDIAWIAGLGFEEFRFPNALRPDVEFKATSELESVRPSASDPTRGVTRHRYQLVGRDGALLFTALCIAMVHRRG